MNKNYKFIYIKTLLNKKKKIYLNINNKKKYIKKNNKMILIKNYLKKKGGSNKEDYSLLKIIAKNKSKSPIMKPTTTVNQIQKIKEQLEKKKEKKIKDDLEKLDKKIKDLGL